jgi:hypothetical protein
VLTIGEFDGTNNLQSGDGMIMRLTYGAAAAVVVAGVWFEAGAAQGPAVDTLKAEVSAAWEDYLKVFAAGRSDVISERVYLAPSYALGAAGPSVSATAAEIKTRFDASIGALVPQNYARTTTKSANICVLNDATAILSAQFTRYRKDGSVLSEPAGTYVFSKTKQGWRIVAQIPHAPERVITCGP